VFGAPSLSHADISNYAVSFLRTVNSAQANGSGGCVVNLVNEESAQYNPAALGLLHLDRVASAAIPVSTNWFPVIGDDDLRLKSWNAGAGASYRLLTGNSGGRMNFAVGLAYTYTKLEWGTFVRTDEFGNPLGTFEPYDAAKGYAIGAAFDYYVRVGFGIAFKSIESRLVDLGPGMVMGEAAAEGDATDYGFLVEVPVQRFFSDGIILNSAAEQPMKLSLTPSVAYVRANKGDDIAYIDAAQSDPLPEMSRLGFSLLAELHRNSRDVFSLRGSHETEQLQLGSRPKITKLGVEVGGFGAFYLRLGSFQDEGVDVNVGTRGFGFRLRGVLDWMGVTERAETMTGLKKYLLSHADLSFDYAKWGEAEGWAVGNTEFWRLAISL
jgi:hypothetical protein